MKKTLFIMVLLLSAIVSGCTSCDAPPNPLLMSNHSSSSHNEENK